VRVADVLPAATDTTLWDTLPGSWDRTRMLAAESVAQTIAWILNQTDTTAIEQLTVGHVAGRL
jgi:NADP-dependent 3-hydroxy acid dehydrogenase YdfG